MRTIGSLSTEDVGTSITVGYIPVSGVLERVSHDYEDESKVTISGEDYYLPKEYPVYDSESTTDYDPSVILGVVDPWSPYDY